MIFVRLMLLGLIFGFAFPLVAAAADAIGAKAPVPDLTTPESALKSYWALREWNESDAHWKPDERNRRYLELMTQVTAGETREFFGTVNQVLRIVVSREIKSVVQETPTRAIIISNIKNVTPIPKEAKSTPALIEMRNKGRDIKYVMVKEGSDWKILEIWLLDQTITRRIYEPPLAYYPALAPLD